MEFSTGKITLPQGVETDVLQRPTEKRPHRKRLYLAGILLFTAALFVLAHPIAGINLLSCMRPKHTPQQPTPQVETQPRAVIEARVTLEVIKKETTSRITITSTVRRTTTATIKGGIGGPTTTVKGVTTSTKTVAANWWKPTPKVKFEISLGEVVKVSKATPNNTVYDIDLFDTPNATITALKAKGNKVICYFSAGTVENWRSDVKSFTKAIVGKPMKNWRNESWVDTRSSVTRNIMKTRINLAKSKGCDAVDPDNIDGYLVTSQTGFPLTSATAIDYVKYLADTAHAAGLGVGLKNGPGLVSSVLSKVDFEVNESCARYKNECAKYQPFIKSNKAVFHIEYNDSANPTSSFMKNACYSNGTASFSTIVKHGNLKSWSKTC